MAVTDFCDKLALDIYQVLRYTTSEMILVLLCVQAFVPPFDALMISTGSEPLRLLPVPFSAEQWQMLFAQSAY